MKYNSISKTDIAIPKGIIGLVDSDEILIDNSRTLVIACCEATKLIVDLIMVDEKIIGIECESLKEGGICTSARGPIDENGDRMCNIKI